MTEAAFISARSKVLGEVSALSASGIGTLAEKTLHRTLKLAREPDEAYHEIEFLGSIADIKREGPIYEIQTHSAERLVPKLQKFLKEASVTVVLPVIERRIIRRLNKATGEISPPKVSPKHESVYTAIGEIYKLRRFLTDGGLSVKLVFLEAEEYRLVGAKRGKRKLDVLPTRLLSVMELSTKRDYLNAVGCIPDGEFTASTLAAQNKCPRRLSSALAGVLHSVGVIDRVGKDKNAYVYTKAED